MKKRRVREAPRQPRSLSPSRPTPVWPPSQRGEHRSESSRRSKVETFHLAGEDSAGSKWSLGLGWPAKRCTRLGNSLYVKTRLVRPPHKWRGACACVRSLRLQRHLFLHVSPMRDGSGHRPRRPFSRGHSGEKSRLAPSPTGRGRSLRDVMSSRPECVGLGFIQQTSPGSLGVREPETRARCWI